MPQWKVIHAILIPIGSVLLLLCLVGCPQSQPPRLNAQNLPGVWRSPQDGFDITWTFTADRRIRCQLDHRKAWLALLTGGVDIQGHWRLVDDQLTIELRETPPNVALFGGTWRDRTMIVRIKTLNDTNLDFHDSDLRFRKSLAPPEP